MRKTNARGYVPTLDGWRALAILSVMIFHASESLFAPGMSAANSTIVMFTRTGAKGVDLFFAISGFLICSRLLEEHDQHGQISLRGFYVRRFLRILPPYWLLLTALIVLHKAGLIALGARELVASFSFTRNYIGSGWYTGHLWSIAVEEHFYLLWPGLLVLWTPERAVRRVVILAIGIAIWRECELHFHLLTGLLPESNTYGRTDLRLDALFWGCWLALLLRNESWKARLTRWLRPAGWLCVLLALALSLSFRLPFRLAWQAWLWPLLIAGTVLHPQSLVGRFLESQPLRWIGRISYSLYLWQQLFLATPDIARSLGGLQELPWNMAAALACASLSYYVVERPMIRLGHRLAPPATEGRV